MLFHEIYGSYYNTVASILTQAVNGPLTAQAMTDLIREKAFGESGLSIPGALRSGNWPLLDQDGRSVLQHTPSRPLTLLEKRWLKSLLSDPRIALFDPDCSGLEEVSPLYEPDVFVCFDQYADGDPYSDPSYLFCFRTALRAIREKRTLQVRFQGRTGAHHELACIPYRLEYSQKDDKFRLLAVADERLYTINVARIQFCRPLDHYDPQSVVLPEPQRAELVLWLHDERNALERVLLHFSHFEKETQKLKEGLYQIQLHYDPNDQTELLIRVLSFGPVLEVKAPEEFIQLVRERVCRQADISRASSFPRRSP